MIELRWLRMHMNDVGALHPSGFAESGIPYMRVLQYREPLHVQGMVGISEVAYGKWRDIPIVDAKVIE